MTRRTIPMALAAVLLATVTSACSLFGSSAEAPTEAPTEARTEALTEAPSEAQTSPSSDAPSEAPTEAPTEVMLVANGASPAGLYAGERVTDQDDYLTAVNADGALTCSDDGNDATTCVGQGITVDLQAISDGTLAWADITIDPSVADDEALAQLVRLAAPLVPAGERGAMADLLTTRSHDAYLATSSEVDGLTLKINGGPHADGSVDGFALTAYGFVAAASTTTG